QPTLGETAAWLLTGEVAPWSVRKGALWWLTQRERNGQPQLILHAVIDPELI
ncbi:phosphohistidine phosphatase, SixA, partial [mine drainage metagenome]